MLPKAGNSHTDERETLLEIFINLFGKEQIACLIGDREFIGRSWLQWLREQGIEFRMRIHENYLIASGRGQLVPVWRLFAHSGRDTPLVIPHPRRMWGEEWYWLLSRQRRVSDYRHSHSLSERPSSNTLEDGKWKLFSRL